MRTLSTIIVIVILLLGGSFASYNFINTMTQTAETHLEAVEKSISAQQWEDAKKELRIVSDSWEDNNAWWSILLDHEAIDTIDLSISRLDRFLDTKDISLSLGELSTLQKLFVYIYDSEQFNVRNIF